MAPAHRSLTIRDAAEADLAAIVDIYNAAIPGRLATADTELVSAESRRAWFREHDPQNRPLWIALADGSVAGWLSFQSFYTPSLRLFEELGFEHWALLPRVAEIDGVECDLVILGRWVLPGDERRGRTVKPLDRARWDVRRRFSRAQSGGTSHGEIVER
jgi:phosphinothricin acetyltransferase